MLSIHLCNIGTIWKQKWQKYEDFLIFVITHIKLKIFEFWTDK